MVMKKVIVLSLFIFSFSIFSMAENVYVAGWASDGMSKETAIWENGILYNLTFLDGDLCGFDTDNGYAYYATYKKTVSSSNRDKRDIEISIYRSGEKLYNFSVEYLQYPYVTNMVVVNGNAYIVVNYVSDDRGGYWHDKTLYSYKIYKNGNLISTVDEYRNSKSYFCEHLEKSNGYVFMAKEYNYHYGRESEYNWGYQGPNRDNWIKLSSRGELERLRVFNDNVYLMGSINGSAYICRNNEKPQQISGYKKCVDFAVVNNSNYWIVDNVLLNSEGKSILNGNLLGMRVYGNNLYVWGMNNHNYCYWIVFPNGHISRVDLPSCCGINNLIITE